MSAADAMKNLTAASHSNFSADASGGNGESDCIRDKSNSENKIELLEVPLPFSIIDASAAALLRSDIQVLLQNQLLANNSSTTPRVITRIFHGIGSPAFPSEDFWNTTFWNRHRKYNFNTLLEFVTKTMREIKMNTKEKWLSGSMN